jgi:hypothetical protein
VGVVVYTCNPISLGGGGKGIIIQGQPGQKCKILSEKQTKAKGLGTWFKWQNTRLSKHEALGSNPKKKNFLTWGQ